MIRIPSITIIAICGCASAAAAQQFSLSLVPSTTNPTPGSTFTASLVADADVGTHVLGGGFRMGRIGTGNIPTSNITWVPAEWSAFNTVGNYLPSGFFTNTQFGQLVIPDVFPPGPGSDLPNATIGHFIFEIADDWDGQPMEYLPIAFDPFSLQVIDVQTGEIYTNTEDNISFHGFTISIPAPGTPVIALACCSPLIRRRRPTP